jgi:hypothetical protein
VLPVGMVRAVFGVSGRRIGMRHSITHSTSTSCISASSRPEVNLQISNAHISRGVLAEFFGVFFNTIASTDGKKFLVWLFERWKCNRNE